MPKRPLVLVLCVWSIGVYAAQIDDEKKQLIDGLLEITGAAKIGEMMGVAVADQMITALSQQNQGLDAKVVEIIRDETASIMHDEFVASGWMNEMSYEIYDRYLSTAELKQLVAFYKTPTGQKVVAVLPHIARESMLAGQVRGQSLVPVIQQRLQARFEREGIR